MMGTSRQDFRYLFLAAFPCTGPIDIEYKIYPTIQFPLPVEELPPPPRNSQNTLVSTEYIHDSSTILTVDIMLNIYSAAPLGVEIVVTKADFQKRAEVL